EVETAQLGSLEPDRKAHRDERDQRQAEHEKHAARQQRKRPAGPLLAALRPEPQRDGSNQADDERRGDDTRSLLGDRRRNDEAAIVEKNLAEQRDALPWPRQRAEHRQVPEQDLEQQRQIAD